MTLRYPHVVRSAAAALALLAGLATAAGAAEPRLLPDVVLYDTNGSASTIRTLQQSGHWVMLLVDAAQPTSQTILNALAKQPDGWAGKVVVVVIGRAVAASAFIEKNNGVPGVVWLLDREQELPHALALKATPTLYAINEKNEIRWQLVGIPAKAGILSMLKQWMRAPAAGAQQ
jgi:hypothetical protein